MITFTEYLKKKKLDTTKIIITTKINLENLENT
jgi:hypothetical protein